VSGDAATQALVTAQVVEAIEGLVRTVKSMLDALDAQRDTIDRVIKMVELQRERIASLEADRVPRP
jgi:endonuclease III